VQSTVRSSANTNCDLSTLVQRQKDAKESASTMESASTSAYQPKSKRRRKSTDVSGPVEASEHASSCPSHAALSKGKIKLKL